jgi:hypothetical protein
LQRDQPDSWNADLFGFYEICEETKKNRGFIILKKCFEIKHKYHTER